MTTVIYPPPTYGHLTNNHTALKTSIIILAICGLIFTACSSPTNNPHASVEVTGVTLDQSSLFLTVGDIVNLNAAVKPDNATNKNVSWSSSNTSIATVNNGKVTAVAAGTANITVTTVNGGKTADCAVTVQAGTPVTGVILDKTSLNLTVGDTEVLTVTIAPANATNKNVTWSSSNTGIATVNNGTVTAVAAGSATITVTTVNGGKTATCAVTVQAADLNAIAVTGVTLNQNSHTLAVGGMEILTPTIQPSNATNKNVSWSSSNTGVATVNNGTVTAIAVGTATITVTTVDGGKTATCAITVQAADPNAIAVTGVTLNKNSLILAVGDTATLTETVTPANASNKIVSWSSSDTGVAAVDNGTVTAVAEGEATITVLTEDGGKTATCAVTVQQTIQQAESFTITFTQISDAAPPITGPTIHHSSANGQTTATITTANPGQYADINWYITGTAISANGNSITLDSNNNAYNRTGEHFLTVEVTKDGKLYNKTVTFTVAP